jgi:hypothetical protein
MTNPNYLPAARAELERLQCAEAAAWNALNRARDAGNRYAIADATHVARWAAAAAFDAERAHDRAMLELGKHTFNPNA